MPDGKGAYSLVGVILIVSTMLAEEGAFIVVDNISLGAMYSFLVDVDTG